MMYEVECAKLTYLKVSELEFHHGQSLVVLNALRK